MLQHAFAECFDPQNKRLLDKGTFEQRLRRIRALIRSHSLRRFVQEAQAFEEAVKRLKKGAE
jgi:hypothetical protein